ncbi:2-dehydropantoate 2-reductase [Bacillus tianshenii]|uniref:2-dehydropantoate 2-reductase n=1 Tax=Sutcliffiella tianshenii TaxID=1463404 RepID=UPI001CD2E99D|nr:2-dehydropantoate 2-reductase [Bacillus tianshenii]MCA1321296.1 2-dehydropantoate 2-reductase [Bacillus tianshenii]
MKIGIIGAGAIGLLYAYQFSAIFPVTLYTKRMDQCKLLKEKGITLMENNSPAMNRKVQVKHISDMVKLEDDVILVAVKQYALHEIMPHLMGLNKEQSVLFLQNGMGHLDLAGRINDARPLIGVVEHGVKKLDDVTIIWTGKGMTKVAPLRKDCMDKQFLTLWEEGLEDCFPVQTRDNHKIMLTEKLIVNAIINPLTTLYRVKNGQLVHNRFYKNAMITLYEEISFLIEEEKKGEVWNHVLNVCRNTAENWSSMQRDIENGRRTEVEAILGYVIFSAKEQGKKVPLTEFIYTSIKGLEENYLYTPELRIEEER